MKCTVGVACNKFVAKMACRQAKPDGFKVVSEGGEKAFLKPLRVSELWGVGKKTSEKIGELGIKTVGELAAKDVMVLLDEFGSQGAWLHFAANGVDDSKVGGEWKTKSVGAERTFARDAGELEAAVFQTKAVARTVRAELLRKSFFFKRVTLKARFSDFETRTIARMLRQSTGSLEALEKTALKLLQKAFAERGGKKLRLVGVRASELSDMAGQSKLTQFA